VGWDELGVKAVMNPEFIVLLIWEEGVTLADKGAVSPHCILMNFDDLVFCNASKGMRHFEC